MKHPCLLALALAATLPFAKATRADTTVGVGATYTFGAGFGVGLKVFSEEEEDSPALSLGLDYILTTNRLRPNLGVQYLFDGLYIGGDVGVPIGRSTIDYSFNFGVVDTTP